jgi:hypothetical protein
MLAIGGVFLWRNLHPETRLFDMLALYWPFLLIAWGLIRLIEVSIWRREGGRHGFSGGEVVLVILICVAGSGIWAAREHGTRFINGGMDWWGQQYDYPVSVTGPAAGMKRIVFENSRGSIKVSGGDAKDVVVSGRRSVTAFNREDADKSNGGTPVEIVPQGDRLLIRTNHDRVSNRQRIVDDLEVTVPRGMSVESRGASGDHEVTDIDGNVEINSNRGDIRLSRVGGNVRLDVSRSDIIRLLDLKGRVDVQGRSNDMELENVGGQVNIGGTYTGTLSFKNLAKPLQFEGVRGTELSAQAVPGRIIMDLGEFNARDVTGPLRLVSRSRDIKVQDVTQSIEVQTERGDIELRPGKLPLAQIEARSGAGKIELLLPEKATFQLEATAQRGEALNDFGPAIRNETEGRANILRGKVGEGPSIKLTAQRGWISVRKEGTMPSEALPDGPKGKMPQRSLSPKELKDLKDSQVKM